MWYDGVVKVFIVTHRNRNRDPFSFVVYFDYDFGCFELLYFFLDQLLTCFLFVRCKRMMLFCVNFGLGIS